MHEENFCVIALPILLKITYVDTRQPTRVDAMHCRKHSRGSTKQRCACSVDLGLAVGYDTAFEFGAYPLGDLLMVDSTLRGSLIADLDTRKFGTSIEMDLWVRASRRPTSRIRWKAY